jgi:hypothetical protein
MQRTHTPSSQHLVRDAHSRPSRNAPSARAVTHAQPSRSCPRQVPAVRHALGARRLPAPTRVRAWWSPWLPVFTEEAGERELSCM